MARAHDKKLRKPQKRTLILASIVAGSLLLVGGVVTALYLYSTQRYTDIFAEVNSDTVESMIYSSEESKEINNLATLTKTMDENGALSDASLREVGRLSQQIADRLVQKCNDYDKEFVLSKEVPRSFFETLFLSKEQKDDLTKLTDLLEDQENDYCRQSKATAGMALLTYDMVFASTNWYRTYSSEYTNPEALESLKKFSDGSYEVRFRSDMIKTSGDKLGDQLDAFIEMYGAAYDYGIETDESLLQMQWDTLTAAQANYSASPLYTGLDETIQRRARESLQDTREFYELLNRVSSKDQDKYHYSASSTTGLLLGSAINMHEADLSAKPVANSVTELVTILNEKRYLDTNLDLNLKSISYDSKDGEDATLKITVESTGKSYEVFL